MNLNDLSVETRWNEFVSTTHPGVSPDSVQYKIMKRVWFCSWFDSMNVMRDSLGTDEVSEEQGAEVLQRLHGEVEDWIRDDLQKELERYNREKGNLSDA